ncbi:MAG: hypothetical protein OQJ96_05355 [Flavobacteriales bacterium]|nr:hypothetical protein [Flavobacteriales bacterium]MCW8912311.1 hypothetical protein [Flavobacteriales bacterium]MCW8937450.1 hypothetical protein [Flavobacteriales bacterium]MCW8940870.1 hypothetical protein [Flavobacteriales bacterium]MCW8968375.1 hypothetical protein [Flavobacteriales bacterium]
MKNITLILLMVLISFKTSFAQTHNINLSDYKNIIARYFSNTFNKNSLYLKEVLIQKDSIFFNTIERIDAQTKVIDNINNLKKIKNNQTIIELVADSSYNEENFSVKEVKYEVQRKVNKDIFVLGGYATFKIVYNDKSITITEIANTGLRSPKTLLISNQNFYENNYDDKEDYWTLSSHLFSYLIKNKSLQQKIKKYNVTSSFFSIKNDSTNGFLNTGPYKTIKFRVEFPKNVSIKSFKDNDTIYDNFLWRVWNCGNEDEKINNVLEINKQDTKIKYQLINEIKGKRNKKELYIIRYGEAIFAMKVKCLKGFELYTNQLSKELFISKVFEKINFYHPKYGCVEIIQ